MKPTITPCILLDWKFNNTNYNNDANLYISICQLWLILISNKNVVRNLLQIELVWILNSNYSNEHCRNSKHIFNETISFFAHVFLALDI